MCNFSEFMEVVLSMCLRSDMLSLLAYVGSAESYGVALLHVCLPSEFPQDSLNKDNPIVACLLNGDM